MREQRPAARESAEGGHKTASAGRSASGPKLCSLASRPGFGAARVIWQVAGRYRPGPIDAALLFTAGAGATLAWPTPVPLFWLLALALPALWPWRGRSAAAWLVFGLLLSQWQIGQRLAERWPVARDGQDIEMVGTIASLPEAGHRYHGGRRDWRFDFVPDDPRWPPRIRVGWYRTQAVPRGGECWRLNLRLRSPHGSANPGSFDYEQWTLRAGIAARASVRSAQPCGMAAGYRLLRLRQGLLDDLQHWLGSGSGSALVAALLIGDRAGLRPRDWDTLRATGITHLVSVSGLHVGIVATAGFFLLRWLWVLFPGLCLRLPAQKAGSLGAVVLAVLYAALAGFNPPVVRACLMVIAGVGALWSGGAASAPRALALAWLLIVGFDPMVLLAPGLWLSFGGVALILYLTLGRLRREPVWRALPRLQLGLSLALVPLTLGFFGGASLISPLVNLVAIPLATVAVPLLLALLPLALAWPALGVPALRGCSGLLGAGLGLLHQLVAALPAVWMHPSLEFGVLGFALFGVLLLLAPAGLPLRSLGLICLLPAFWPHAQAPSQGFRATVLDVGQGLSVIVRTSAHTLVFDTGPAWPGGLDMGRAVVLPALRAGGVRLIDRLIISHADLDHRGGAPAVRAGIPVRSEWGAMAGQPCRDGQHWRWDQVDFTMLSPVPGAGGSRNDRGCVLRVAYRGHALLLPADIEAPAERALLRRHRRELRADVLVAPHHGSAGSSTPGFVAAVAPRLVVYPAGWENRFDFPRAPVVARYRAAGSRQLVSGDEGAIRITVGPNGITRVQRFRCDHPRRWRVPPPRGCASIQSWVGLGASP
jgi:DNA internalization-related competence protein ComEC/Rec2